MPKFSHRLEYTFLKTAQGIFSLCGLKNTRRIARVLGRFVYKVAPIRKDVVIRNLSIAFPDKTPAEIDALARRCYIAAAVSFAEILCIPSLSRDEINAQVKIPSVQMLNERYAEQKGVILLTAHFGNWEFAFLAVGMQLITPIVGVVKNQSNDFVTADLNKMRTRWGNKVVTLGVSIREIYKALKNREIVSMVGDQRGPTEGPRVLLFNRPSAVYTGPAALAIKSGAPLYFGVMIRQPDESYEMAFHEVSKEGLPEDEQDAIIELTQRHSTMLEAAIRQQPESWFWMHNRWKY
jgi:KDO2-lipid IV(A) lauroyltransferase